MYLLLSYILKVLSSPLLFTYIIIVPLLVIIITAIPLIIIVWYRLLTYNVPAGSKVNIELSTHDLDTLLPGEYINDKVVDFYLRYSCTHARVHCYCTVYVPLDTHTVEPLYNGQLWGTLFWPLYSGGLC